MQQKNNSENILVVIVSDEPWCDVWHTQLHYAYQLSNRYMVYYVAPPEKWKFNNLFLWKFTVQQDKENLFVINYHNVFPVIFMNSFFVKMNDIINSLFLKGKIPKERNKIIFWRFTHYRFLRSYLIKPFHSIYHVVDHYMGAKNDSKLAKRSDMVISTSPKFVGYYKGFNKNVINIPQAVSNEEFICDDAKVSKIRKDFEKIILFIGTLSSETNFDILEKISELFSEYTLLIIGPDKISDGTEKKKFENLSGKTSVKYIGTVPAIKLKNYVRAADVCIIPYKFSYEKKMSIRSPLKAISYIAQKKPVITTIDCEIKELENKIIYTAKNLEEFISLMKQAIDKKLTVDEKAVELFLKKINYETLLDFIFTNLEK